MEQFPTIIGPRFFLFKLDFNAAYHNFLVRSTLRDLFGVEFEGEFYTYNALPFGFRAERLLAASHKYLHGQSGGYFPALTRLRHLALLG